MLSIGVSKVFLANTKPERIRGSTYTCADRFNTTHQSVTVDHCLFSIFHTVAQEINAEQGK